MTEYRAMMRDLLVKGDVKFEVLLFAHHSNSA